MTAQMQDRIVRALGTMDRPELRRSLTHAPEMLACNTGRTSPLPAFAR